MHNPCGCDIFFFLSVVTGLSHLYCLGVADGRYIKRRVDTFFTTRSVRTFDVQHTVMTRLANYKPITYDGINFRAICPVCKEWGIYGRINLRRTAFNATCPSCCDTEADKGLSTIFDNTMTRLMKQ